MNKGKNEIERFERKLHQNYFYTRFDKDIFYMLHQLIV